MDDTRVRDALERLAADAPLSSAAVWERTQQRIARRRRTRVLVTGAVVVALLLGAAGVVAAVRSNNDGDRIAAGPADVPRTPNRVLAVVNGRFEMRSAPTGGVERDGDQVPRVRNAFDVATVPSAPYFVYTQQVLIRARTIGSPGSPLVRVRTSDGARTIVTDGAALAPTISPDGRLVAYRVANRTSGAVRIAVRDLATLHAAAIVDPSSRQYFANLTESDSHLAKPLAWTPDSKRLLIDDGTGAHVLLGVGMNAPPRLLTTMPDGVTHAVYIDDDKIAIAYRQEGADADTLAIYYVGSGALRPITANETISTPTVSRLSFDPTSGTVLATVLDSNGLIGRLVTFNASESHEGSKIYGLTSASWFATPSGNSTTKTEAASVVPDVLGLDVASARSALQSAGFRVKSNGSSGSVFVQQPAAGVVTARGATVTISVCPNNAECRIPALQSSLGGAIAVPDFRGMSATAADAERVRLGFDGGVTTEKYYGTSPEHTKVFWQDPPPGTLRRAHDDVRMWACPTTEHCVSPPQDFIDFPPDALSWRSLPKSDAQWSAFATRKFDSPEALARAVVDMFERAPESPGHVTYTVAGERQATAAVWVQIRNAPDDSVEGADYEFVVTRTGNAWVLHDGRVRTICVRGVASADSCL